MLIKLAILLLAVFGAYSLMKSMADQDETRSRPQRRSRPRTTGREDQRQRPRDTEMVRCPECGLYFPKSEAVEEGGRFFCSDAHRKAHK